MECMEQFNYTTERDLVCDRAIAIVPFCGGNDIQPVKFTSMLMAFESIEHLVHEIVNIQQLQLYSRVVDLYGKVIGYVITESGYG